MNLRLILIGLFLLAAGCARNVAAENLIGTFVSGGVQKLELKSGGIYRNTYSAPGGRPVTEEGTWELELVEGVPTISLTNFRSPLPEAKTLGAGFYLMQAKWNGKKLRLYIDDEKGVFLEKLDVK